jgi:hypothetical protein
MPPMTTFGRAPEEARLRDVVLVLVATFGLAACITLIWLGMRAVMDIGGACAEGGPFVPVQPCPEGAPAALTLGMLGIFGFGALGIYAGAQIGGGWAALPLIAWPALFGSLGWNFLEYGFSYEEGGIVWGWVIPGVVFIAMAVIPLWFVWTARASTTPIDARFGLPAGRGTTSEPDPSLGWDPSHRRAELGTHPAADELPREDSADAVDRLERLAEMRGRGDITNGEYERFKQALLRDVEGDR